MGPVPTYLEGGAPKEEAGYAGLGTVGMAWFRRTYGSIISFRIYVDGLLMAFYWGWWTMVLLGCCLYTGISGVRISSRW